MANDVAHDHFMEQLISYYEGININLTPWYKNSSLKFIHGL